MEITPSTPIPATTPAITELSGVQLLLLPLLLFFARSAQQREHLRQRAQMRRDRLERKRVKAITLKEVQEETERYARLIVIRWTQLGERSHLDSEGIDRNRGGRKRVKKIEFEVVRFSADACWYKIKVTKKTLFGHKNVLPYGVRVVDLIDEGTLRELSYACERRVTASDDPYYGAWVIVHRLQSQGLLPEYVSYTDALDLYPDDMTIPKLVLGIGENRTPHKIDFEEHPHLLIAGSTKSGKSNIVNNFIASIIRLCSHHDVQFALIDFKRNEFNHFAEIPHLYRPIVYELDTAVQTLIDVRREMENRFRGFHDHKVKDIETWNKRYPAKHLPRLIVVIDEFAEMAHRESEDKEELRQTMAAIKSVSNLGRAAGIHLWICTQRPDSHVVPMQLRNNVSVIIGGRTGDPHSSAVIMGTRRLYYLPPIKGRMAYKIGPDTTEIQTPHIQDDDIAFAVKIARGRAEGVIAYQQRQVRIDQDGLLRWITANTDGLLIESKLLAHLRPLGIGQAMLRAWLQDIKALTEISASDKTHYEIARKSGNYLLIANAPPALTSVPMPPDVESADETMPADDPITPESTTAPENEPPNMDFVGQFIADRCVSGDYSIAAGKLYSAYLQWCALNAVAPLAKNAFGAALKARGYKPHIGGGGRYYRLGITLQSEIGQSASVGDEPDDTSTAELSDDTEDQELPTTQPEYEAIDE